MENYLPVYEKVFYEKTEKTVTCEAVLPDYLPNVSRIVRVSVLPSARISEIGDDTVNAEGRVVFTVVYASDFGDKLKCAVFPADFAHSFPVRSAKAELCEDGYAECTVSALEEKGSVMSPRKMSLSCRLSVCAEGTAKRKNGIFDPEENESLKKLTAAVDTLEITELTAVDLRIDEKITLDAGMPGVQEIVFADCALSVAEAKLSENGCTFSGNAAFTCMYLSEQGEDGQEYISLSKNIPFTASTALPSGVREGYVLPKASLVSFSADAVRDSYGDSGIIAVAANGSISSRLYHTLEASVCEDVFCIKYPCECQVRELMYDSFCTGRSERVSVSENVHASLGNMTEIVSQTAQVSISSTEYSEKGLVMNLFANVKLMGTNELGGLESANMSFGFKVPFLHSFDGGYEKCRFDTIAEAESCKCTISNGEVKCGLDLVLHCAGTGRNKVRAVVAAEIDDMTEFSRDKTEYVIYYPDKDDTVWSTAKKYRVSPSELMAVNGLKNESELAEAKTLVIPR